MRGGGTRPRHGCRRHLQGHVTQQARDWMFQSPLPPARGDHVTPQPACHNEPLLQMHGWYLALLGLCHPSIPLRPLGLQLIWFTSVAVPGTLSPRATAQPCYPLPPSPVPRAQMLSPSSRELIVNANLNWEHRNFFPGPFRFVKSWC